MSLLPLLHLLLPPRAVAVVALPVAALLLAVAATEAHEVVVAVLPADAVAMLEVLVLLAPSTMTLLS